MTIEVTRDYNHKAFGTIGYAQLAVAENGEWTLNGTVLPQSSVMHLVNFSLQTLQDAYAGAKTADEAKGMFMAKRDRLMNGTLGTRSAGDGASQFTTVARSIVRGIVKAKYGSKSPEWATFIGLSDADQAAKLDAIYEKHEDALKTRVEDEVARREADRKAKAALSDGVSFDL